MMTSAVPSKTESGVMSFLRALRTVAWAFLGLRRSAAHQEDFQQVKPIHVIAVGILGALALVLGLLWVVNIVLGA